MDTNQMMIDQNIFDDYEEAESRAFIDELKHLETIENVYDFEYSLLKKDIKSYQMIQQSVEMRNNYDLNLEKQCSDLKDKYYKLIDFISDFDTDDIARYNILEKGIQYNKEKEHLTCMLWKHSKLRKEFEEVDLLKHLRTKEFEFKKKQDALKLRQTAYQKRNKEMKNQIYQEKLQIRSLMVNLVLGSKELSNQMNEIAELKKECEQLEADIKKNTDILELHGKEFDRYAVLSTILPKKSLASKIQTKLNLLELNNKFQPYEHSAKMKELQETTIKNNSINAEESTIEDLNSSQFYSKENENITSTSQVLNDQKSILDTNRSSFNDQKFKTDKCVQNKVDESIELSINPKSCKKVTIFESIQLRLPDNYSEIGSTIDKKVAKKRESTSSDDDLAAAKHRRIEKLKRKSKPIKNEVTFLSPEVEKNVEHKVINTDVKTKPVATSAQPKHYSNQGDLHKSFFDNVSNSADDYGSFILSSGEDEKNKEKENNKPEKRMSDSFQFDSDNFDLVFDENGKAAENPNVKDISSFFL